jgi:hypothetical protein
MVPTLQTEIALKEWRLGQTGAERLCADILQVEEFNDVNPQSPLGGSDGKKDILCNKNGIRYVAACFFPPTNQSDTGIERKFFEDLPGVARNDADGFIFFTNQHITPFKRAELVGRSGLEHVEIYHVERLRTILDSPKGYGLRLSYLQIPLTIEEQTSFFDQISKGLVEQVNELTDRFNEFAARTEAMFIDLRKTPSSLSQPLPELPYFATENLTIQLLFWVHRIVTDDTTLSPEQRGSFRNVSVWVRRTDYSWVSEAPQKTGEILLIAPPPSDIYNMVDSLLRYWRSHYRRLLHESNEVRIAAIADFHHKLLIIHPFLDGNGKVARAILQQHVVELLNRRISARFTEERKNYLNCLISADHGDLEPLITLIKANLE